MTDQAARPAPGDRAVPAQRVVLAGLAMLSVLAAVIHFAVAGSHFQEYWLFGVFLLGVAWLQLGWAAAALLRPTRLLVSSGAVLNAAVIVVYILTRTVGNIVGPDPGEAEPAGFGGLAEPGNPGHDARLVRAHPGRADRGRRPGRTGGASGRAGRGAAQRHGVSWDCTS
jgi:hypothetical protein